MVLAGFSCATWSPVLFVCCSIKLKKCKVFLVNRYSDYVMRLLGLWTQFVCSWNHCHFWKAHPWGAFSASISLFLASSLHFCLLRNIAGMVDSPSLPGSFVVFCQHVSLLPHVPLLLHALQLGGVICPSPFQFRSHIWTKMSPENQFWE